MDPKIYYVLHVLSGFLLVAWTFQVFAAPDPASKKGMAIKTGVASLVMLVAGFGLQAKLPDIGFPVWLIVKIVCWLALSALAGMVYRKPEKAGVMQLATIVIVTIALVMVYVRPFL